MCRSDCTLPFKGNQRLSACFIALSRMAITNHLATVFWLLSGMASCFTSSYTRGLGWGWVKCRPLPHPPPNLPLEGGGTWSHHLSRIIDAGSIVIRGHRNVPTLPAGCPLATVDLSIIHDTKFVNFRHSRPSINSGQAALRAGGNPAR
jgi:hypothetical protein